MSNCVARTVLATAAPALVGGGAAGWALITKQLKDQRITVHPDHARLAGKPVAGPFTAYAQAEVVGRHAEHVGGGKTFAELSEEWMAAQAAGDTARVEELTAPRETVMQANFVRTSLYTSVLAYGVSALAVTVGAVAGAAAAGLRD